MTLLATIQSAELKSMSKVCASSHIYEERFSSGLLEMRASALQIIILKYFFFIEAKKDNEK